MGRKNLPEFLHNCLSIERSFDKFKLLGEDEERIYKNEQNMLKTLEIEQRLNNIRNSLIKEDKDLDKNDLETEVEYKDLDEIAQNLSSNLDRLNSKEKSENLTVEEINSIEDPMEAYNKIIVPALEGINNINININSITAIFKTDASIYKNTLRNDLKNFMNNLPEENREKLKNNLSKEGIKEKLNEVSEKSGIKLGDVLLKDLNKEKVMVRRT